MVKKEYMKMNLLKENLLSKKNIDKKLLKDQVMFILNKTLLDLWFKENI